jgi:hypothetical protein
MGTPIDISGYGKLSIASSAGAPLLIVFGGIPVKGRQSGVYMWDYMNGISDRFHIFVAAHNYVDGNDAYDALMKRLETEQLSPSRQILYLFSGGYRPGKALLQSKGTDPFTSIFLVDIWMGITKKSHSTIPDFYKHLVNKHSEMITYVYTSFGANNDEARDYIASKLGPQRAKLVQGQTGQNGMDTHMSTNTLAVSLLP